MKLLVLALCVAASYAACPNGCNGHGSCGTSDVCDCYRGWFGGDCSGRSCPHGPSWTATPTDHFMDDRYSEDVILSTPGGYIDGADFPLSAGDVVDTLEALYPNIPSFHQYAECSSRGTCDYATGECKCFDGFEGRGCRRTICPNSCSGHGRCLSNGESNADYNSYNSENDQFWDFARSQACTCDRGFSGYDCSHRICPFGDDPTTDCGENSATDYQLVHISGATDGSDYFTLTFTDMFGGKFTTRPIGSGACDSNPGGACSEVQYALMELPNAAIPEIEVDFLTDSSASDADRLFLVYFSDSSNTGKQNTLQCELISDSSVAGAGPLYDQVTSCDVYDVGGPEWFDANGDSRTLTVSGAGSLGIDDVLSNSDSIDSETQYEDFVPCANKGDCDGSTGVCTCNDGHFGEACELQSTYY